MKKINVWARAFFALLLTVCLIVLGFIIFRAGIAYGSSAAVVAAPITVGPFGTVFLIVSGFILFLFSMKLIMGALFFPMLGMRHWRRGFNQPAVHMWKYGKWGEGREDFIREWHQRLHEDERQSQAKEGSSA